MRSAARTSRDEPDGVEPAAASESGNAASGRTESGAHPLPAPVAARLGQLAHDLRNPLNSIAMNAELITLVVGEEPSAELGESLDALERAVEELGTRVAALDGYVGGLAREMSQVPAEASGGDDR